MVQISLTRTAFELSRPLNLGSIYKTTAFVLLVKNHLTAQDSCYKEKYMKLKAKRNTKLRKVRI